MITAQRIISDASFSELREIRASAPEKISQAHAARHKRRVLTGEKLFIIAADHPARGALQVGGRSSAMANRYDLLERLAVALSHPGVDGVLATPDIIDDLALLGLLENKIVVGSLNRGGLAGASFEMDDRMTAYDIASLQRDRLDFAKTLLRINLDDAGTLNTLTANSRVVSEAAAARIPIMLEPFMNARIGEGFANQLTTEAAITSVAIAAGLGNSSSYTWLKIPAVDNMEAVMEATTLPTLILGGDAADAPEETYSRWQDTLALPGVRGLVVGRTLLFPSDDDVQGAINIGASLVHNS